MKRLGRVWRYGDNVNTDEIIPARYLVTTDPGELAAHCMEDIDATFAGTVRPGDINVAGRNFGCGSSREHAPWALEVNGINLVIAESFARIFRQNMYNCGMMAIELPRETIKKLFVIFSGSETIVKTDLDHHCFTFVAQDREETVPFNLAAFDRALVKAGGWIEYASLKY